MLDIKILGPNCSNCTELERLCRQAVKENWIEANIEKVSDLKQIAEYNVMMTPALVINGKVVHSGSVPTKSQIVTMLMNAIV